MFEFESIEQKEMRSSVRKLAERRIPSFQTSKFYNTVPRELFSELAAIGTTGLSVPEAYGGTETDALTAMIVMEELAKVDLGPAIFISVHTMVAGLINKFGSTELKERYLPRLASGKLLGAFALTEPSAGSDAASLRSKGSKIGTNYILNGEKCYITSAGFADIYIVFARTGETRDRGITAFIVEAPCKELEISTPESKMGCELSPIASIKLNQVEVPSSNILGSVDKGFEVAMGGLASGRVNIAACANGISRAAIDRSIAHLKEREQFGKKLAEFQALQFMLADMQIHLEAAQLLTWQAARELDRDPAARSLRTFASEAKCFATDAAMRISTDAVQLLGGAGYIKEFQLERLMREAKMLQIVEGTNQIQRQVIAKELLRD